MRGRATRPTPGQGGGAAGPGVWGTRLGPLRRRTGLLLAVVGVPALTAALVPFRDQLPTAMTLIVYLLVVVVVAATGGLLPALVGSVLGVVLANWFLTPPYNTLAVARTESVVELVVFVLAGGAVSVVVELGARSRVAAAAEQARADDLAAVDRVRAALLAAVGHDLRTPLAATKAAVSSLRQDDVPWSDADRAELLATVEESTDRLTALVDNLLDLSRLQAGALSVDIEPVVAQEAVARALTATAAAVPVADDVPEDLPLVDADPGLLERVLVNLVDNAARFSPDGSAVAVTARESDGHVEVSVVDHGPGVAEERWPRLFVPFQREGDRAHGGVGLGLAIARGFTEAMGGTLTPSRTPGGGLTMTVRLRRSRRRAAEQAL
ncbi:sensor histidine kinase [Thalassiella azotivora]